MLRMFRIPAPRILRSKYPRILLWVAGIALLFVGYTSGLSHNPPGFYVDESAIAYNAYLVSRTGAGEFGSRFPLYFQMFTNGFTQYVSPTQVYLLAVVFRFLPPSILLARSFSAFWVFAACLLLGFLAKRVSGQLKIGLIVAATALLTPWFFEVRGLVLEPHFVPFAVVLLLLAVYHAHTTANWTWRPVALVAAGLTLLTYCYSSGRMLGPLLAFGLLLFATTTRRFIAVLKVWLLYGITLIPTLVYNRNHPGALTSRFFAATYMRPGVAWRDAAYEFVRRYLEDQSLTGLLQTGHPHPRHHVIEAGGVFFFATFTLAMIGLLLIVIRHRRDPWWRFVLYGLAVSIVPGAITYEPFHALRLLALPVFLSLLTVPALEWLVAPDEHKQQTYGETQEAYRHGFSRSLRLGILIFFLALTTIEAVRFQIVFRREGPKRGIFFDAPYKEVYDAAVAQPARPIYLIDGYFGPASMHAFWHAAMEGRPRSEFVYLGDAAKHPSPPIGGVVISSDTDKNCRQCQIIKRSGVYLLYRAK
jgi:4-amino-4-deoxy-L-arabinose transferase-like glycosyltransferase